jgi:membrane associated rhomboid family serine protease
LNGRREPIFNAPWPPVAMAGAIVGLYAWQSLAPLELVVDRFGFSPAKFAAGDWAGAVTALFVHGTWMHGLLNAAFALAFGAPVARFLGGSGRGLAAFFTFYLGCGVLANLGHAAVHPGDPTSLVGASGAVAGLMGAAARLIATRGARLGTLTSPPVISMTLALLIVNLLLAVFGAPGSGGMRIAWEAHLFGFAAGLLGIGPITRLFGAPGRLDD